MEQKYVKYQNHLELTLGYNQDDRTISQHQYTTYPLRLSSPFRLEGAGSDRVYHYVINTSPGLLAGDRLNLSLQLTPNTRLYLTDQAATKVHPMPENGTKAVVNYQIIVDANANLELVPEPVILYADAVLEQKTAIKLHSTAKLFLSEIILPGRLAKQEYYQFNSYLNRLMVTDLNNNLLFSDATFLTGKQNQFKHKPLFTTFPIMGSAIAILPDTDPNLLITQLDHIAFKYFSDLEVQSTILPTATGIYLRALSRKTSPLKQYFNSVLNCIRLITNQSPLPYIPK